MEDKDSSAIFEQETRGLIKHLSYSQAWNPPSAGLAQWLSEAGEVDGCGEEGAEGGAAAELQVCRPPWGSPSPTASRSSSPRPRSGSARCLPTTSPHTDDNPVIDQCVCLPDLDCIFFEKEECPRPRHTMHAAILLIKRSNKSVQ